MKRMSHLNDKAQLRGRNFEISPMAQSSSHAEFKWYLFEFSGKKKECMQHILELQIYQRWSGIKVLALRAADAALLPSTTNSP